MQRILCPLFKPQDNVWRIALLFLLFLLSYQSHAEEKSIRVMFFDWPPYAGSNLPRGGYTVDIVTSVFQKAGYKVEYQFFPWLRALKNLDTGRWDALVNLYYTEERSEKYAYPKNHLAASTYTLFALKSRKDIPDQISAKILPSFRVGLVGEASYGERFDQLKQELPSVRKALRERLLLKMMLVGRVDLVPADLQFGWYYLNQYTESVNQVRTLSTDFFNHKRLYPVFSKHNNGYKDIVRDWDITIEAMKRDGSLEEVYQRHGAIFNP